MPRNAWSSNSLQDKYLNFFTWDETSAATTSLQTFEFDTGMTPRGGFIWEIHFVEMLFVSEWAAVAAAAVKTQVCCLSFIGGQATMPTIGDYGSIWLRAVHTVGNGTYNQPHWFEPNSAVMYFPRPFLYAKNKLYLYYQTSVSSASQMTRGRIGYTTKKISGSLLWEAVEQFLSEA